jgi:hypothetical protein
VLSRIQRHPVDRQRELSYFSAHRFAAFAFVPIGQSNVHDDQALVISRSSPHSRRSFVLPALFPMPRTPQKRAGKAKPPAATTSKATVKDVEKAAKSTISYLFYTLAVAVPTIVYFSFLVFCTMAAFQRL